MSKQDLVHRASERASAPIGHPAVHNASPTPTPWELSDENPRLIMKDVPGMSDGFDQYCIAEAHYHGLLGHKESQNNAAFIVKAVNAHEPLTKRIATLEAALEQCLEYFKNEYDVNDGSYGEPSPNKEMQLGQMITEALYGPGVV